MSKNREGNLKLTKIQPQNMMSITKNLRENTVLILTEETVYYKTKI